MSQCAKGTYLKRQHFVAYLFTLLIPKIAPNIYVTDSKIRTKYFISVDHEIFVGTKVTLKTTRAQTFYIIFIIRMQFMKFV